MTKCTCDVFCDSPCPLHSASANALESWIEHARTIVGTIRMDSSSFPDGLDYRGLREMFARRRLDRVIALERVIATLMPPSAPLPPRDANCMLCRYGEGGGEHAESCAFGRAIELLIRSAT